jgi:hypothetical protein
MEKVPNSACKSFKKARTTASSSIQKKLSTAYCTLFLTKAQPTPFTPLPRLHFPSKVRWRCEIFRTRKCSSQQSQSKPQPPTVSNLNLWRSPPAPCLRGVQPRYILLWLWLLESPESESSRGRTTPPVPVAAAGGSASDIDGTTAAGQPSSPVSAVSGWG